MSSPEDIQPAPSAPQAAPSEAVAPADQGRISLAPIDAAPAPATDHTPLIRRLTFLDGVMVFLLLVFAFVTTATEVSNSDILLHLATGRLIAQGQFSYADPFCFTTSGWWVNHSWLFDTLLYLFHAATDQAGVALSVLKSLVFTAVAFLIVLAGRKPGERLWFPVVLAALGLLAISFRPLLGPSMISTLFTAVLMLIFARHKPGQGFPWAAPLVCLLWANCDAWFFLGPLLALLFLAGNAIQSTQAQGEEQEQLRADLPRLVGLFAACLGACLINPYFVFAFTALPAELHRFGSGAELSEISVLRYIWFSPVEQNFFQVALGLNAAGLSFFVLAFLGVVSLVLVLDRIRWWRALVFVVGLGLALLTIRAIPFFAVICCVVASLNFQEASERFLGPQAYLLPSWRGWAVSGRSLTIVILAALSLLVLPGWLHPVRQEKQRVAFGLLVDEGLRDAALRVAAWREEGLLEPGQRWFNVSPEAANYFAWYCPGEKLFIDTRVVVFPTDVARDYRTAFKALREGLQAEQEDRDAWKGVLAKHKVRMLAFHYPDLFAAEIMLGRLYLRSVMPNEGRIVITTDWEACHISGKAALFAWTATGAEAEGLPPFNHNLPLFFDGLAFGPEAERAPDKRPAVPERSWYALLVEGEAPSSAEAYTARQHDIRFRGVAPTYGLGIWCELECSLVAMLTAPGLVPSVVSGGELGGCWKAGAVALYYPFAANLRANNFARLFDRGPPSSLYLSLRAARRALARNPEDPAALMALSASYIQLRSQTRETHPNMQTFPHLSVIRQTQVAAPLQAILRLKPTPRTEGFQRAAHRILADTYPNTFLDLKAHHFKEYIRMLEEALARLPGTEEQKTKEIEALKKQLQPLETDVLQRMKQFDEASAHKSLTQKAEHAMRLSLAGEALRLMKSATVEDLRPPMSDGFSAAYHYLDLLLATGQVDDARNLLQPFGQAGEKRNPAAFGPHRLGGLAYDFFLLQAAAASGDYKEADQSLADQIAGIQETPEGLGMLVGMDVLPKNGGRFALKKSPENLNHFAALAVGSYLLREAQVAMRFPWNALLISPSGLHPPHNLRPHHPRTGVPIDLRVTMIQFAGAALHFQAERYALRALLALEQGRCSDARGFADEAMKRGVPSRRALISLNPRVPVSGPEVPAFMVLRLLNLADAKGPLRDGINP
jgi:hypothetical protein